MKCNGSYRRGIRVHPITRAAECSECSTRFDHNQLAGEIKNIPLHSTPGGHGKPAHWFDRNTNGFETGE
jgi:hypothetical protein